MVLAKASILYIYIYILDKVMIFYYLVMSKKWKENRGNNQKKNKILFLQTKFALLNQIDNSHSSLFFVQLNIKLQEIFVKKNIFSLDLLIGFSTTTK